MPDPEDVDEPDGQELAEVFDEENITPDGRDIATSDMQRDVFDATSVPEDADEALEPSDDWDPDAADEAELEAVVSADEGLDQPRTFARDSASLVLDEIDEDLEPGADEEAESAPMESDDLDDDDVEALGYAGDDGQDGGDIEDRLDEALDETFPASDPVSINRR